MKSDYPKFAGRWGGKVTPGKIVSPVASGYTPREVEQHQSLSTPGGSASLKEANRYTGDKVLGVTIVHKSCLQPVFSDKEAKEFASMRR